MYDNIDLKLDSVEAPGVDLLNDIPERLNRPNMTTFSDGAVSISGYLGTLKVRVSSQAVKVKDSSLCKWYLGDNFQGLSRGDTRLAIEKLSDSLLLPMDRATVTRIDVAHNLIVKHEKAVYFNHLGALQYFKRLEQPNGLYYSNTLKTLLLYEKVHEQKDKGQPVPEMYQGREVIRYEQRYKRRLLQCFNLPELRASSLYDPAFYIDLVNRWRGDYERIKKLNEIQIDYSMIKTKREQALQAILFYIKERGGEIKVLEEIKEAQTKGELSKKQAYDLRQQVEEACKCDLMTARSEVIEELDKKVKEAARFYL